MSEEVDGLALEADWAYTVAVTPIWAWPKQFLDHDEFDALLQADNIWAKWGATAT
ncbi:hypothetical protein ACEZDB_01895 [Streptacidiphilus sp. N1-3]|uniref:Uncharacterized protein n=1 Tax=Streptacidiphilus alkalitolerans TaxID=3342712 RepID=A0ABV6WTP2_9ACTN